MKYFIISILFVLVSSCNGQKKTITENASDSQLNQENTAMVLLLQEEYSEFDVTETLVIKDQKNLKSFYSKLNRTRKPGLPVPLIDFEKEMVIIHCNGKQSSIGMASLSMGKESDSEILLFSKHNVQSSDTNTAIVGHPFCVYKMPLSTKKIVVEIMTENPK